MRVRWGALASIAFAVCFAGCSTVLGIDDVQFWEGGAPESGASAPNNSRSATASTSHVSSVATTATTTSTMSTTPGGSSTSQASTTPPGTSTASGSTTAVSTQSSSTTSRSSSTSSQSSTSSSTPPPPVPPCTFGTAYDADGSLGWYYFGQGTAEQSVMYKPACGYLGTESGSGMTAIDTVSNIANTSPAKNTYFAAISGASGANFDTVADCGACVEIANGAAKIVATVIDECPADTNPQCVASHLDLSTQAFDALSYAVGNPSGVTWKFVPCPVTGNIQAVKNGTNQYYLQNAAYPISTVAGAAPTNFGYFAVAPGSGISVVSAAGNQTLTLTIPTAGGDTGAQFASASGCY